MHKRTVFFVLIGLALGLFLGGQWGLSQVPAAIYEGPIAEGTAIGGEAAAQQLLEELSALSQSKESVGFTVYTFEDSMYAAWNGIRTETRRELNALSLLEGIEAILGFDRNIHSIAHRPADDAQGSDVLIRFSGSSTESEDKPLSLFYQKAQLYCLAETLRGVPGVRGFQLFNISGEPYDESWGLFCMSEPCRLDRDYLQEPQRGLSQLHLVQEGEELQLQLALPHRDEDGFVTETRRLPAQGASQEETVLRAMLAEASFYSFIDLEAVDVIDNIAYAFFVAPSEKMGSTGSHGAHQFYEMVKENLRQFEQIEYVQILFNGQKEGLHGMTMFMPDSLR